MPCQYCSPGTCSRASACAVTPTTAAGGTGAAQLPDVFAGTQLQFDRGSRGALQQRPQGRSSTRHKRSRSAERTCQRR
ncbi:hypothetical protein G3436_13450 [Pseudomonas sp. MAFF212427]|uniref:Uncharacterized protein n=1 Tax=Pseudomonas brassicae TaxID=2708063 RepID=A0A6B3NWG1_9PSED|nr:hypothetical protein [Pseudomonas brassicae]NER64698.1 hypothetical protein [Pseudomonas brassicae]